jgi:signal transduction histidine kinase
LLINAVLHNPPNTKVHVWVLKEENIKITTQDDGKGMNERILKHLQIDEKKLFVK